MIKKLTPETDAFAIKFKSVCGSKAWVPTDICRRFERERDEAREALKHIEEYGTEEINAAVELRQKLAQTLIERDEARAVAGAMADIAFKHLTSLLASTQHSKDAAHDEETQQVIAAIKQWKELKQ